MALRRPIALTRLIDTFARVYPDLPSSRMVVVRAGIDPATIAFDPRALVNWTEIVSHAVRKDALDAVIEASADGDLHPELLPETQALVAEYRKWAATNAATPEDIEDIAEQPVPGFIARTRTTILSWSGIAVGCFAVAGAIARESRHIFLGLPGSHASDIFKEPAGYAGEGFAFLRDTFIVAWHYTITANPWGVLGAATVVVAVVLLGRRLPRLRHRFSAPFVVIPLILAGAAMKTLWYDAPVAWYSNVVLRDYHPDALIVPRVFTDPARARWKSVVCSRVAGNPRAAALCGNDDRIEYRQNVEGAYLLDAGFTVFLCTLGIFAIRKLLFPSHDRAWNLSRRRKWRAAIAVGTGLLFTLLPLPSTYSRTVGSTTYPYICPPQGDCYFRICVEDQCHKYKPGDLRFLRTGEAPENSRERSEDILSKAFQKNLDIIQLTAPL